MIEDLDLPKPVIRSHYGNGFSIYAPLTAGLWRPVSADTQLPDRRPSRLDQLYRRVAATLDQLLQAVGLKAA